MLQKISHSFVTIYFRTEALTVLNSFPKKNHDSFILIIGLYIYHSIWNTSIESDSAVDFLQSHPHLYLAENELESTTNPTCHSFGLENGTMCQLEYLCSL